MHCYREILGSTLKAVSKIFPSLSQKHVISPLLVELNSNPHGAWLLAFLAATPSLAASILPSLFQGLIQLLQSLSSNHKDQVLRINSWEGILSISSAILKLVEQNVDSSPLTPVLLDSLVQLSCQAGNDHWQCCFEEVTKFIELLSVALFHNTHHASRRLVMQLIVLYTYVEHYSWCNSSMKVMMSILLGEPSCTNLNSCPPNCLCLPLLTALLAAAPLSVGTNYACFCNNLC